MPRDQRLYMTFPNDVHRHPKIMRLSVEARWAFIEMNGEARIADNDGLFTAEEAEFHWPVTVLDELCASHPTRPLLVRTDSGGYLIRDYAEHQQTRAERERLAAISRENGRKGGRPKSNPAGTQTEPRETQGVPSGTQTKAESESESESPDLTKTSQSQSLDDRANDSTDAVSLNVKIAAQNGITDLSAVARTVAEHTGREITLDEAWQVANSLLQKARTMPTAPMRYVLSAIAKSPFEVQQYIDTAVA